MNPVRRSLLTRPLMARAGGKTRYNPVIHSSTECAACAPISSRNSKRTRGPKAVALLTVVEYRKLLVHPDGRTGLGQRFAVRGSSEGALVHVLAILLPEEIDGVGSVFGNPASPSRRKHRTGGRVILAVEFRVAHGAFVAHPEHQPVRALRGQG